MVKLYTGDDLTLQVVERVVFGGERLELAPELVERIELSRVAMEKALASGARVYGVNTGMGYQAQRLLVESEQMEHQRQLMPARAIGSGPYLTVDEARAVLTCRLRNLVSGRSGASPGLVQFMVDRLNDGFTPAIPREGAGSAGEVVPLAHAFQTLLGMGWVLDEQGEMVPAGKALAERGVRPVELSLREGSALIAGAPGTIGVSIVRHAVGTQLAQDALITAACAIHALGAPRDPYSSAVGELSTDPLFAEVLVELREQMGPEPGFSHLLQAPVSFRVVPQVHTHLRRTLARFKQDLSTALAAVDDSPALVEDRFVSTGGFHVIELAAALDGVALAWLRVAELAGQHAHRLLDHRFSGLPDQLTTGAGSGVVGAHKRLLGSLHRLRRHAIPASVGIADSSLGQEDAMTFSHQAAEDLRQVEKLVRQVLACSLLISRQGWALGGKTPPSPAGERVAKLIKPVTQDRPLGEEIDTLAALIEGGGLRE